MIAFGVPLAELGWLAAAVVVAGIVTGILAGLFGIGGGAPRRMRPRAEAAWFPLDQGTHQAASVRFDRQSGRRSGRAARPDGGPW